MNSSVPGESSSRVVPTNFTTMTESTTGGGTRYSFGSTIEETAKTLHQATWRAIDPALGMWISRSEDASATRQSVMFMRELHLHQLNRYLTVAMQGLDLVDHSIVVKHNDPVASEEVMSSPLGRPCQFRFCGDNYSVGPAGKINFDIGVMKVDEMLTSPSGRAVLTKFLPWDQMDPKAGLTVPEETQSATGEGANRSYPFVRGLVV